MKLDRVLAIDKPSGLTSHDVVSRLRRSTGVRRIGHAGTLDPAATGVLVILIGKATRLSQFIVDTEKEYRGSIVLGTSTDTHDAEGSVLSERPVEGLDERRLRRAMNEFTGRIEQVPPMTSAVKRDGRPLYELARKGVVVERKPRPITIHSFEFLRYEEPRLEFALVCSKGTYVRRLAHDLGERLGTGAHLAELVRTRVGRFSLEQASPLSEVEDLKSDLTEVGLTMFDALSRWPALLLHDEEAESVVFGGSIRVEDDRTAAGPGDHLRLTEDGRQLLAVGRVEGAERGGKDIRPVKVFETP
ncbi:MAG: tRNA pseudouridine(55) synthase TruB [Candidatus Eisenbacteria bacterium]|nr:tRNA pseudouridine(55) synthase TruB [Candidatus Eisenbacteria bacterium]